MDHHAWIDEHRRLRCTCDQFLFPRYRPGHKHADPYHCQHTDVLRREQMLKLEATAGFYFIPLKADHGATKCAKLLIRFKDMVERIAALTPAERYLAGHQLEKVRFPLESGVLVGRCDEVKEQFVELNARLHQLIMEAK